MKLWALPYPIGNFREVYRRSSLDTGWISGVPFGNQRKEGSLVAGLYGRNVQVESHCEHEAFWEFLGRLGFVARVLVWLKAHWHHCIQLVFGVGSLYCGDSSQAGLVSVEVSFKTTGYQQFPVFSFEDH